MKSSCKNIVPVKCPKYNNAVKDLIDGNALV